MEYQNIDKEDFDAVVTGQLAHYGLWLEEELNNIITDYFITDVTNQSEFRRLVLYREGLTFQDKIEIVRGMLPLFGAAAKEVDLKSLLKEIEDFKSWRNALAHGLDVSPDDKRPLIKVEVVTRSGKEKQFEITPKSHKVTIKKTQGLLMRIQKARKRLTE